MSFIKTVSFYFFLTYFFHPIIHPQANSFASTGTATVSQVQGSVFHNNKKINKKDSFPQKGTIVVKGIKSFADIRLSNNEIIRFRQGKFKLSQKEKTKQNILTVITGEIYAYFQKNKTKNQLKIETKTAVLAVRGTKFMVSVEKQKTYLCVCEGEVTASKISSPSLTIPVKKGDDIWIEKNKSLGLPKPSGISMMSMVTDQFRDMGYPVKK